MAEPNHKWDFFLAHAGRDAPVAEALYDLLASHARVFLDSRNLLEGDNWDEELASAQRHSLVTVVLVSPSTDQAYYQREEIAAAIDLARKNKDAHRVVPLYWQSQTEAPVNTPYGLRLKHGLFAANADELPRIADRLINLKQKLAARSEQVTTLVQTQQQALTQVTQSHSYKERFEAARAVMEIFPYARTVLVVIILILLLAMVATLLFAVFTRSFDVTIQAALAILGCLCALAVSCLMMMWNKSVNLARDIIQGTPSLR